MNVWRLHSCHCELPKILQFGSPTDARKNWILASNIACDPSIPFVPRPVFGLPLSRKREWDPAGKKLPRSQSGKTTSRARWRSLHACIQVGCTYIIVLWSRLRKGDLTQNDPGFLISDRPFRGIRDGTRRRETDILFRSVRPGRQRLSQLAVRFLIVILRSSKCLLRVISRPK